VALGEARGAWLEGTGEVSEGREKRMWGEKRMRGEGRGRRKID
jgi:hypothetical protein